MSVKASNDGTSCSPRPVEHVGDRAGGGEQRRDRVDHEREAELADAVERELRRLAAVDPVEHERHVGEGGGDRLDLLLGLRRLDEQRVGARLAVAPRALERAVEALDRARVGAGDDQQLAVAARLDRGAHLLDHLGRVDHLLALHVAAALRRDLVLDVQRGDAGRGVLAHRAHDVERVAVAVVGVGDQRHARPPARAAARGRPSRRTRAGRRRAGRAARPTRRSRSCRRRGSRRARPAAPTARRTRPGPAPAPGRRAARGGSPSRAWLHGGHESRPPRRHRRRAAARAGGPSPARLPHPRRPGVRVGRGRHAGGRGAARRARARRRRPAARRRARRGGQRRHGRARGRRLARERPAAARALRPRDRGRRPGRAGGRGLRRLGRALDAAGRARRPGRPGLPHLQDRELLRLPGRHRGRAPRAAGGAPGRGLRRRAGAAARCDRQPGDARGRRSSTSPAATR